MSVSSVSHRAAPQPVQQQPAREPVKARAKEPQDVKPAVKEKPPVQHPEVTYSNAKEKIPQHAAPKGRSIDVKA